MDQRKLLIRILRHNNTHIRVGFQKIRTWTLKAKRPDHTRSDGFDVIGVNDLKKVFFFFCSILETKKSMLDGSMMHTDWPKT